MKVLRSAALVILGIAALDGILDGIENIVARLTGRESVDLWPMLLSLGLVVLVVDLLIEYRATILKCLRETGEWIQSKISGS